MEHNYELIDQYLSGNMSVSEAREFEWQISQDPLLKNEVDFQRDIINSIREYRKAQLKSRLNNIKVGNGYLSGTASKIAASIVAGTVITASIWYIVNINNTTSKEQESQIIKTEQIQAEQQKNTTTQTLSSEIVDTETNHTQVANSQNKKVKNKQPILDENASKENATAINTPEGIHSNSEDRELQLGDSQLPQSSIGNESINKLHIDEVKIDASNKKDFSYKYSDNKLYLYGDFESKTYSIVEYVPANKVKQFYLNFEGKYYELKPNQYKPVKLRAITDSSTIAALQALEKK
ncbi:MAG: hypothetical protein NZ529_10765 [Cytophagaceae bacterium]|nr:hypothetical protein [Cytophagaceae bacterium]MDW8457269.1 hypothetical protein [Cytophagaceae bacterium]